MRGPSADFFRRTRVVALHGLGSSIPGRLLTQVRVCINMYMGEEAARAASVRADGDREEGGAECGFGEGPGRAG